MNWFDKIFRDHSLRFLCLAEGDGGAAPAGTDTGAGGGAPASSVTPPGDGAGSGSSSPTPDAGVADSPSDFEAAFGGFDDDLDSIEIPEEPSTGTDPGAVTPPATGTPPGQQSPPAAQPAQQTPPQQPAAAQPQPQAPSAPQSKREELDEAIAGFKSGFDDLAKWAQGEMFTLTQDELDLLATDAATAVPAMMAKTYTRAVLASLNFIKAYVPEMIAQEHGRLNGVAKKQTEAVNEFYAAWPQLNPKDHGAAMAQAAKAFRQMNPQASRKDAIDFVGRYLMTQFGIQAQAQAPARQSRPFVPARPGGHTPVPPPVNDPYAGMDQEFDEV